VGLAAVCPISSRTASAIIARAPCPFSRVGCWDRAEARSTRNALETFYQVEGREDSEIGISNTPGTPAITCMARTRGRRSRGIQPTMWTVPRPGQESPGNSSKGGRVEVLEAPQTLQIDRTRARRNYLNSQLKIATNLSEGILPEVPSRCRLGTHSASGGHGGAGGALRGGSQDLSCASRGSPVQFSMLDGERNRRPTRSCIRSVPGDRNRQPARSRKVPCLRKRAMRSGAGEATRQPRTPP
jgi:hypothetical protein